MNVLILVIGIKPLGSGSSFFYFINGSPKGFFWSSWGLRQGDPLSALLFVIVVEAFMFISVVQRRLLPGFHVEILLLRSVIFNMLMILFFFLGC